MDIAKIRENTPGVKNVIHFNNAGASLMSKQVFDAIQNYSNDELNFGGYETADKYTKEIDGLYDSAAKLINASPEEIAYCESATVAWQRAFFSIPFKKNDVVVTGMSEYASNYISYLKLKNSRGIQVQIIPNNSTGDVDLVAAEQLLSKQPKLLSINHIPTHSGIVNPAEKLGELARKYGVLYLLDSCQSIGQYPVDVKKIQCDFLCATGRKYLRGPRGTGFLFSSKSLQNSIEPLMLDLHSANWETLDSYSVLNNAKKFETWESNLANKIGLKVAIDNLLEFGINNTWNRIQLLGSILRSKIENIEQLKVEDIGDVKCGIVTFSIKGYDPPILKAQLQKSNINVSIVDHSSALIDMRKRELDQLIRASVHYYNTEEEIEVFCSTLSRILNNA